MHSTPASHTCDSRTDYLPRIHKCVALCSSQLGGPHPSASASSPVAYPSLINTSATHVANGEAFGDEDYQSTVTGREGIAFNLLWLNTQRVGHLHLRCRIVSFSALLYQTHLRLWHRRREKGNASHAVVLVEQVL